MDSPGLSPSRAQVQFSQTSQNASSFPENIPQGRWGSNGLDGDLRRRRSSMSMRFNSLRQVGGVNSIENFARSWQRAANFFEIAPARPSFVYSDDGSNDDEFRRSDEEGHPQSERSLLRQQFDNEESLSEAALEDDEQSQIAGEGSGTQRSRQISAGERNDSLLSASPLFTSPFTGAGSYGASYGTLGSRINESSMRHAGHLWREQQAAGSEEHDKEHEPLLVKRVERDDGKLINVVVGQSTIYQTIFNSVNVLIGVGLLSLPLGIRYAGWLIGMLFLLFSAISTGYTATLLAKCLDVDHSLVTFADLAYISFGHKARIATSILFFLELIAACVALVVLFADSLNALIPALGIIEWKIVCGIILIPLGFLPLRMLSFSSILGIFSCFSIVAIVFIDGFIKPHTPGSLREPAPTYLFPKNWSTVPLSLGLLMSPWGGHSVFPNIYRDMRHPQKYNGGLKVTFAFTYLLDVSMAVAGLLMFGDGVRDEVTSSILLTTGYPRTLSVFIVIFIAIIPLTKIPLNARPIVSTLEVLAGIDIRAMSSSPPLDGMSGLKRGILKVVIRILTTIVFVAVAIVFPSFDRIMALLGSAACFTICIILPIAFYLKLFGNKISLKERILDWFLMIVCAIMAVIGTIWAFLPKEEIDSV